MKKKKTIFIILLFLLGFDFLKSGDIDFSGYYKSFFIVFDPVDFSPEESQPLSGIVSNHLRFNILSNISDNLSFQISYDLIPKIEDKTGLTGFSDILNYSNQYRAYDLDSIILPKNFEQKGGNFALYQNLDRAYFRLNLDFADIYIGRQSVSWGSGKIINPTDIFSPFSFNELDKEERRGVDGVRVRIPTGDLSELDLGYIAGDKFRFEKSGFFIRSKFYAINTDFSLMVVGFQNNLLLGIDIARSIGGAGVWFEGAYVKTNFYNKDENKISENYLRISTGTDYNFKGLYLFLEYHYNGAGAKSPEEYLNLFSKDSYRVGTVYLMGKHYVNIGSSYQISGILSNSNIIIFNISDSSVILSPQLEYNLSENIYLSIGAFLGLGKSPSYNPYINIKEPYLKSEFGTYPDMFYSSFKVYF